MPGIAAGDPPITALPGNEPDGQILDAIRGNPCSGADEITQSVALFAHGCVILRISCNGTTREENIYLVADG